MFLSNAIIYFNLCVKLTKYEKHAKTYKSTFGGNMKKVLLKKKSHLDWSWILMILFFLLSIINIYFGILGLICMTIPFIHTFKGHGKLHCSHYCPRGSIFGKFLPHISLNKPLPEWMRTKTFKNFILIIMIVFFSFSMYHSSGDIKKISFGIFRLMLVSTVIGTLLGVFFKPRAWCQVCPMGHGTGMLDKILKKD